MASERETWLEKRLEAFQERYYAIVEERDHLHVQLAQAQELTEQRSQAIDQAVAINQEFVGVNDHLKTALALAEYERDQAQADAATMRGLLEAAATVIEDEWGVSGDEMTDPQATLEKLRAFLAEHPKQE